MKLIRNAVLAAPLALLAACGGPAPTSANPTFSNAAPSYSALAMDQTSADASSSSVALTASPAGSASQALLAPLGNDCHPHLFVRTHEVVERVNRHLYKFLRHVERLMSHDPQIATGTTHVWESVENGLDRKFTITKVSDTVFTWKLEMEAVGSSSGFVTIFQGQIDRTGATGPHQGSGNVSLDLTALHSLVPTEHVQGQIAASFDSTGTSRKIEVTATNVTWDVQDPNATAATITALEQPRSGHYVYFREPGTGGSLKIQDQMVFLCPANPSLTLADVDLVSRWYKLTDGTVHGRSDTIMTGGQLAAPVANVQGVTCHDSASETTTQAESYWMMKSEDATGATIAAQSSASVVGGAASTACDAALGVVPDMTDKNNDYSFAAINFTDDSVVPFPNMK
jgi:hypothetical protein